MNIGVVLKHLSTSQIKNEVFDIINAQYGNLENSYTIFFENVMPNNRNVIAPLMELLDARFFSGRIICFDISVVQFFLNSSKNLEIIYYAYDLDFIRNNRDFLENTKILRNEKVKLFSRSKSYAKLLSDYSNKGVVITSLEKVMTCQN